MIHNVFAYLTFLSVIGLAYYYSIFLYRNIKTGLKLLIFDEVIYWNKYVEKPRLLIYALSGVFFWIAFTQKLSNISILQNLSILSFYMTALFLVHLSHRKFFINALLSSKNISKKELIKNSSNTRSITDTLIKKKWFRGKNIGTSMLNLLSYKLDEIENESIICAFDKKIQLGRILFQLKDIGHFSEAQLKDIYQSNLITTSKGQLIKDSYSFHKNKLKNTLYNNDEINLKKYF